MKIVEIITDLTSRAGAEVFLLSLINKLKDNPKDEVYLVTLWGKIEESFSKFIKESDIKYFSCGKNSSLSVLKPVKKLKKIIKAIDPDIVHTHGSSIISYYFAFGKKKQKWNLFHTFHNIARKESNKLGIWVKTKLIKANNLHCVGISRKISETITEQYSISQQYLNTIYNGVELKHPDSSIKKEFDVICVARFEPQKNHMFLINAIKEMVMDGFLIKVALVGDGSLFNECKTYVTSNGLSKYITFTGAVSDIYDYLVISKIFVLVSVYEGNPISILEAMDSGIPIISSSVGGVPDVIKNNRNGFLFEVNDTNGFINKIQTLLSNDNLMKQMHDNNIRDVARYSMEECAKQYHRLFKDSLKQT